MDSKVESLDHNENVHRSARDTARMEWRLTEKLCLYEFSAPFGKYCRLRDVEWSL